MDENQTLANQQTEQPQIQPINPAPLAYSQAIAPNTVIVNGQPFAPSATTTSQQGQVVVRRPSKWRYFFIFLGVLQTLGVATFVLALVWLIHLADSGASGTEFIALLLYVTLIPAVALVALVNIIGLPIFMVKRKPHGVGLVLGIVSLLVSCVLFLYGSYIFYQLRVVAPRAMQESAERYKQEVILQQQQQ